MAANEQASGQVAIDIASKDQMSGLKAGEYLIHVFVEETRALKHPEHDDSTVDPLLKIDAGSQHRLSKSKDSVGSGATYWGEHFFFEKNFSTSYEAEKETITISVLDHNSFGTNALIGNVEFNLSAIYQKPKHCIQYQWAALSGLTKKFREVLGFIKFSIGVFHSDDDQMNFEDEKILDNASKPMDVLYPPQIETKTFQIRIRVYRGENLKKMDDLLGKCDPYVKVEYAGMIIQTKTLKVTLDPVWNEEILMPASLPTINDKLNLKLIDWDAPPRDDEIMGTHLFSIQDIQQGIFKNPFWINIYGPPNKASKKFEKIYTEVPETATEWQARLQISIDMREDEKPTLICRSLNDQRLVTAATNIRRDKYQLRAEIHYALNLPKEGKYFLTARWGKAEVSTSKRESKNKVIEFYESLVLEETHPVSTLENIEIPDVFIYLNDTSKNFSFYRVPYTEFTQIDAKARCYYFTIDHAVTTKRDDLAGIVKMRVYLTKTDQKEQLAQYGWSNQVARRPAVTQWRMQFNVFQAKGLVSGDASGLSDPFLVANLFGTEKATGVIDNTLNPIWNERLEFITAFDAVQDAYPLALTLWDKDTLSNDFIGSAIIVLDESHLNPKGKVKPQWIPLKFGKAKGDYGQILVSVCCYSQVELIPKSINVEPEMQRYYLNLKIIGLRELKSVGLLPVKRAFVRFDLDSVARKGDKALLQDKKYIRTEPVNSGANPNILTVINLDLLLPVDPEYCPALNCAVFDYVFKGLSQPLIGNFSIPLEKYIRKTQSELDKRIDTLTKLYTTYREAELKKEQQLQQQLQEQRSLEDSTNVEESKGPDSSPRLVKRGPSNTDNTTVDISIDTNKDDTTRNAEESDNYVIKPVVNAEGEEANKPDPAKYMELGYNSKTDKTSTKHYRYYLNTEFERSALYDEPPFDEIPIFRGRQVTDESFLKSLMGGREDYHQVGEFKSMINIMSENEKMRYDAKLAHVGHYANTKGLEFSDEEFLKKRDVLVRVYMIEADSLPDKDDDSNSDPYLILKLGDTVYNEHKLWQLDCPNPKFHKCYEFQATFPGASKLSVEVWDHDDLVRDDLIGTTVIDLEDRWFSPKWRILKNIPIETRKLYHPSSKLPQGTVKLWVDIIPRDVKKPPVWSISPKPPMAFELRVIVWECKNVPRVDFEDAVDIFINGRLDDGQHHRTDTHFRSQNGFGSFNWRMVYPVTLPMKKHRITFQIMDKDLLSANDYISEASLDFTIDAMRAYEKEQAVTIMGGNFRNEEKFWVPCSNTKVQGGKNTTEELGDILVSMQLIPMDEAKKNPVGQGRGDPNQNPFLPPPTGRISLTLNPLKMFEQMVGPKMRRKIYQYICLGCCLVLLVALAPIIVANVISRAI